MKYHGKSGAEWGFKNPTEGWFDVVITDDIDINTNKDSGKSSLLVTTKVISGEMAGAQITIFCPMGTEFGEHKVADIIENVGLQSKFDERFPGDDVSYFDAAVIRALQQALPNKPLRLKLEPYTKDGKTYGNIVKIDHAGAREGAAEEKKKVADAPSNW